jgi:signal peptidase I
VANMDELHDEVVEEVIDYTELINERKRTLAFRIKLSAYAIAVTLVFRMFSKYADFNIVLNSTAIVLVFSMGILATILSMIYLSNVKGIHNGETTATLLKKFNDVMDIASIIPIFVAVITILNVTLVSLSNVDGNSMLPNYEDNEDVIIMHYPLMNYARLDTVVVKVDSEVYYIKRVIGLPGETVVIDNGEIYIDGVLLNQSELGDIGQTKCPDLTDVCTYNVPDDSYFVLGDNRENSSDSRLARVGFITEENMFGKVVFHYNNLLRFFRK